MIAETVRKSDNGKTQRESLAEINILLDPDDQISEWSLAKYINGSRTPNTRQRMMIDYIMGEASGACHSWEATAMEWERLYVRKAAALNAHLRDHDWRWKLLARSWQIAAIIAVAFILCYNGPGFWDTLKTEAGIRHAELDQQRDDELTEAKLRCQASEIYLGIAVDKLNKINGKIEEVNK